MTPLEVRRAYHARTTYDTNMVRRPILEAGRLAGWLALLPHSKKGSREGPADLYPFAWETTTTQETYKPITLTPEQVEAEFARFNKS